MIWEPFKVCTMSSVHRVTNFKDMEIDENLLSHSVKSFSDTRWACRYDVIRAIDEQMESAIKVMIFLSKIQKVLMHKVLLGSVCNFNFILSNCILKFILSNRNAFSTYLQGEIGGRY